MAWHYRIFHTRYADAAGNSEDHFSVRRIYYKAGAIVGISARGIAPAGTTHADLRKDHALMQGAFRLPVLTPADIPDYTYNKREVPLGTAQAGD